MVLGISSGTVERRPVIYARTWTVLLHSVHGRSISAQHDATLSTVRLQHVCLARQVEQGLSIHAERPATKPLPFRVDLFHDIHFLISSLRAITRVIFNEPVFRCKRRAHRETDAVTLDTTLSSLVPPS